MLLASPVAGAGDAERLWAAVAGKIEQSQDYRVLCDARGPLGRFKVSYGCIRPNRVRVDFLEESPRYAGSTSVYDPALSKDRILLRTAQGNVLARRLDHKDVIDSGLYQSLFDQIVALAAEGTPRLAGQETIQCQRVTRLEFELPQGGRLNLWVGPENDILRCQEAAGGKVVRLYEFLRHEWDVDPQVRF